MAEMLEGGWVRKEEVCNRLGIGSDVLELCMKWEIICTPEPRIDGALLFPESMLDRLSRGLRLHRDLEINWPGVSVTLDLLDRLHKLEAQLQHQSDQRFYKDPED